MHVKIENANAFIEESKEYIRCCSIGGIFCGMKRNESGAIPNSFPGKSHIAFVGALGFISPTAPTFYTFRLSIMSAFT